jgi:hypothetical protein
MGRFKRQTPHEIDDDIVAFAMRWRHWGGGSAEDIFVQFGMSSDQYFRRLYSRLETVSVRVVSRAEAEQLRAICRKRLDDRQEPEGVPPGSDLSGLEEPLRHRQDAGCGHGQP